VYQANFMKEIMTDRESGVHAGLDALAKTPEFILILQQEVTVKGFQLEAVTEYIPSIYH